MKRGIETTIKYQKNQFLLFKVLLIKTILPTKTLLEEMNKLGKIIFPDEKKTDRSSLSKMAKELTHQGFLEKIRSNSSIYNIPVEKVELVKKWVIIEENMADSVDSFLKNEFKKTFKRNETENEKPLELEFKTAEEYKKE